jgi:xanthine dehydrogenase molybdopterin-binding subunit B
VRLAVNRNTDMAMIGGRCALTVTYDVGFDEAGRITALNMTTVLEVGASL